MFGYRHRRSVGTLLGAGGVKQRGVDNRQFGRVTPTAANEGSDPYFLAGPQLDQIERSTVRIHATGVVPE